MTYLGKEVIAVLVVLVFLLTMVTFYRYNPQSEVSHLPDLVPILYSKHKEPTTEILQNTEYMTETESINAEAETSMNPMHHKMPFEKLVYLKIGKTGSTTFNHIFAPYSYHHNLPMILPTARIVDTREVNPGISWDIAPNRDRPPALMASHGRYNRLFFDKIFPGNQTAYMTSIRDPVTWFISFVDYRYEGERTPRMYLNQDNLFYRTFHGQGLDREVHNYLLQYFGYSMGPNYRYDEKSILSYIELIEKKYDLIMITEYTVESLVLLRRLLNWSMKEIFYRHRNSGSYKSHTVFTEQERRKLLDADHNRGDWLLYQHFNKTFWNKVSQYPDFYEEVEMFVELNKKAGDFCQSKELAADNSKTLQLSSKWEPNIVLDYDQCLGLIPHQLGQTLRAKYSPFLKKYSIKPPPRSSQPWPGLI